MQRTITVLFIVLTALTAGFSQGHGKGGWKGRQKPKFMGSLKGKVIDKTSGKPVEFASVVLIESRSGKEKDGQITSESGKFKFNEVPVGHYKLAISFIGYADTSLEVSLTRKDPYLDVGKIGIAPTAVLLGQAEVKGEKVLIEQSIDKISFNAEKDRTLIGGDGTDVLRKVPLLTVDQDGNVSLGGSKDVKILINGKPSTLFSTNPGDALKMLPADQVKRVEVLTSPGAKYDAEGTAGIINIVTKKNRLDGISGRVNGRGGYPQNRFGVNVNAAQGRLGGSVNGSLYYGIPRAGNTYFYREKSLGASKETFLKEGTFKGGYFGYWGQGELIYELNGYNSIGTSLSWGGHNHDREGNTHVDFENPIRALVEQYDREESTASGRGRLNWATEYTRSFDNEQRLFTCGVQLENVNSNTHNILKQNPKDPSQEYLVINENEDNIGNNIELTGQVDYKHPLNPKWFVETGAKAILRNIVSDFSAESLDAGSSKYNEIPDRTDIFFYRQSVYAGYLSSTYQLDKWGFMAGVRYEDTQIEGHFDRFSSSVDNKYNNIVPNVAISRKLSITQTIKLSYNQRIRRPSLFHINPYINQIDRRNIQFGNPDLKPAKSDKIELSYTNFIMGSSILAKLFYRNTSDVVSPYTNVDSLGVASRTFYNIGLRQELGLNLFTSLRLGKKFTIRLGGNIINARISSTSDIAQGLSNTGFEFGGHMGATYNLPNDYSLEVMAFGRSPRVTVQGFEATFWMTSFSFQKSFWNRKASLGLAVIDPFWDQKVFSSKLEEPGFYQESRYAVPFRSIGLKFSYSFGKLKVKKRFKSHIKNDDLLEGGGDGNGGGGMK